MKFFISADMEGIAGVVSWKEYESDQARYRRMFTAEVNAVCEGIMEGGERVEQIVVCDAHGSALNLLVEALPENVLVSRGSGRPLMMLEGIERGFDLAFFVGYHSGAGTAQSLMDHTYSSRSFYRILLNGREMDEAMINAALCGYYDVPVGFISGDDKLIARAKVEFPGIVTVETKKALSRFAAVTRHPNAVLGELKDKAAHVAARTRAFQPYRVAPDPAGGVRLTMHLVDSFQADMAALIPGIRRLEGRVLEYPAQDMLGAYRILRLAATLAGTATAYL